MKYYFTIQNYYKQYLKFISFVKDKYPQLIAISQIKIKTYTKPLNKKYKKRD